MAVSGRFVFILLCCVVSFQHALTNGVTSVVDTTPPSVNCGAGWEEDPNSDNCYQININMMSWTDAQTACQSAGGQLASIDSVEEQLFISAISMSYAGNMFWIGASEKGWQWINNSPFGFINWDSGQPNNAQESDCAVMIKSSGRWDDLPCNSRYGFICKKKGRVTLSTPRPASSPAGIPDEMLPTEAPNTQGCLNGYTRFRSSCYKFYAFTFNWTDAESYCVAEGGHLVSLDSVAEQAFIEILTQKIDVVQMWVGLRFTFTTQEFAWSDGWPVAFTNWGQGQPALTGMDSCASHTIDGQWQDVPCVTQLNFVCEQNLVPPPTPTTTIPVTLAACPDGNWQLNGDYCYYFEMRFSKSWPGANYACHMLGAVLLTIHTDDEARYLTGLVTSSHLDSWIGLNRGEGHGFAWADSSPLEYLFWDLNEPSDPEAAMHQDCVKMSRQNGMWSDTDCFDNNAYICKMPSTLATTQTTQSAVITTNAPAVQSSGGQIIQSTSGQVQPVNTNGPATSGENI